MRLTLIGLKKCVKEMCEVMSKKCADMRKLLLLSMIVAICAVTARAQNEELNRLTDIVKSLRTGGEKAYNEAIAKLSADKYWTPMDELGTDYTVECKTSDRVPGFRLKSIINHVENEDMYQSSTGDFLNGADARYNYSLFEKTLKNNCTASFSLPQRWGEQIIVIIPFKVQSKIEATANGGVENFLSTQMGNGCVKLTGSVDKGKPLKLTVANKSGENISYVIINYNSRK